MAIFLGKTNSGDQNFLNPLIYHRDTSLYMDLKLFGATPSGRFASILSNLPVKHYKCILFKKTTYAWDFFFVHQFEKILRKEFRALELCILN